jgi:hypothetical protein
MISSMPSDDDRIKLHGVKQFDRKRRSRPSAWLRLGGAQVNMKGKAKAAKKGGKGRPGSGAKGKGKKR